MSVAGHGDRRGLADREETGCDDAFIGVGDGSVADFGDHVVFDYTALGPGSPVDLKGRL